MASLKNASALWNFCLKHFRGMVLNCKIMIGCKTQVMICFHRMIMENTCYILCHFHMFKFPLVNNKHINLDLVENNISALIFPLRSWCFAFGNQKVKKEKWDLLLKKINTHLEKISKLFRVITFTIINLQFEIPNFENISTGNSSHQSILYPYFLCHYVWNLLLTTLSSAS